jgi:hypothetical protein
MNCLYESYTVWKHGNTLNGKDNYYKFVKKALAKNMANWPNQIMTIRILEIYVLANILEVKFMIFEHIYHHKPKQYMPEIRRKFVLDYKYPKQGLLFCKKLNKFRKN